MRIGINTFKEVAMKTAIKTLLMSLLVVVPGLFAQSKRPMSLVQTIPLPGVRGRIDHLSIDLKGHRLFVSALGNDTVEVIDLASGKDIHSITGMREPQGVLYVPESGMLFVANGGDGTCRVLDGHTYKLLSTVHYPSDADDIRYDSAAGLVYVAYGTGGLGVLSAATGKELGTIKLSGHPEAFEVENRGARIYVNIPDEQEIAVADWNRRSVILRWPMKTCHDNFPMAFDSVHQRLFVGCRRPPELLVLDSRSGKIVSRLKVAGDTDDLYYDAANKRIYVSGGQGVISVVDQIDADHYRLAATIPTASGARTSLFVPELKRFYLAGPRRGPRSAAMQVYKVNP
ncbi:MAG: YncE family protein [Acidobacteriota bacterium]